MSSEENKNNNNKIKETKKRRRTKEEIQHDDYMKSLDMTSESCNIDDDLFMIHKHVCVFETCIFSGEITSLFSFVNQKYILHMKDKSSEYKKKFIKRQDIFDRIPDEAFKTFPGSTNRVITGHCSSIEKRSNGKKMFVIEWDFNMIPPLKVDDNLFAELSKNSITFKHQKEIEELKQRYSKSWNNSYNKEMNNKEKYSLQGQEKNYNTNATLEKDKISKSYVNLLDETSFTDVPDSLPNFAGEKRKPKVKIVERKASESKPSTADKTNTENKEIHSGLKHKIDVEESTFDDESFSSNFDDYEEAFVDDMNVTPNLNITDGSPKTMKNDNQEFIGIDWELDGILDSNVLQYNKNEKTQLKVEFAEYFDIPIQCFLAFLPITFWICFLKEINVFAQQEIQKEAKKNPNNIGTFKGYKWDGPITLSELMTFFGIMIYMVLNRLTGYDLSEYWNRRDEYPFTSYLSRTRFFQIRALLHMSRNGLDSNKEKDSLFKVRSILNTLKTTLPKYIIPGKNLALDESSPANKTSRGRDFIFFNKTKPGGKFHFRFYVLCCSSTYAMLSFIMCSKKQDDLAQPKFYNNNQLENDDIFDIIFKRLLTDPDISMEITNNEKKKTNGNKNFEDQSLKKNNDVNICEFEDADIKKISKIILALTKAYWHSGRIVNCDNYYGSIKSAIDAGRYGILMRATLKNLNYFPKYVCFNQNEGNKKYGRGAHKFAVSEKYNIAACGWLDGNPVKVLSTADGTGMTYVKRKIGREVHKVLSPLAIEEYNNNMNGVDLFDQLMAKYSLNKRHKFNKYYKSIIMIGIDFALTQAWIHYKLRLCEKNADVSKNARVEFMESVANDLCQKNWEEIYNRNKRNRSKPETENSMTKKNLLNHDLIDTEINQERRFPKKTQKLPEDLLFHTCHPVSIDQNEEEIKSRDGKSCQICLYEGRGVHKKNCVYCPNHKIRVCTSRHPGPSSSTYLIDRKKIISSCKDFTWMCPDNSLTCWQKYHVFYHKKKLFIPHLGSNFLHVDKKNKLFKKRQFVLYGSTAQTQKSEEKTKKGTKRKETSNILLSGDIKQKNISNSVGLSPFDKI